MPFQATWHLGRLGDENTRLRSSVGAATIYNRDDLINSLGRGQDRVRCTDEELVVASFERWGERCVNHIDGRFVFAFFDRERGTVTLIRDHLGLGQMVYTVDRGRVLVGSNVAVVLEALGQAPTVDRDRIVDALIDPLEAAAPSATFFCGIHRVPAACITTISATATRTEKYWRPTPKTPNSKQSIHESVEVLRNGLTHAIDGVFAGPDPVAVLLSGGIDSSVVAALASKYPEAIAISGVSSQDGPGSETCFARRVATHCGLDAHEVEASMLNPLVGSPLGHAVEPDGLFDYSMAIPHACFATAAAHGIQTTVDGTFADNLFGALTAKRALRARIARLTKHRHFASDHVHAVASAHGLRLDAGDLDRAITAVERLTKPRAGRAHLAEHEYVLVGIQRYARVAAHHGIDARHPWLDRKVIDAVLSLPTRHIYHQGHGKVALRTLGETLLPSDIAWRPKGDQLGASFNEHWLRQTTFAPPAPPNDMHRAVFEQDRLDRIQAGSRDLHRSDYYARAAYDWIARFGRCS